MDQNQIPNNMIAPDTVGNLGQINCDPNRMPPVILLAVSVAAFFPIGIIGGVLGLN